MEPFDLQEEEIIRAYQSDIIVIRIECEKKRYGLLDKRYSSVPQYAFLLPAQPPPTIKRRSFLGLFCS